MSKWLVPGLVIIFMIIAFALATRFDSPISYQVIAASTSITVAALGLWLSFKKAKP